MMQWLKHAFAIDKPGPAQPTPEQKAVVDRMCQEVVRRRMSAPAIVFLETLRPLNFVSAQALHFFSPFVSVISDTRAPTHLAAFLEHRGSIDYLCDRIEELDAGRESAAGQTGTECTSTATEHNDAP